MTPPPENRWWGDPSPENRWWGDPSPENGGGVKDWPKISIVTPSFNQGAFLEETIQSVLSQKYPNLEYLVMDGGSGDNSVEIIKKYENRLSFWVSEPDGGQ